MRYLISDNHFNHESIIAYEERPFKDVNDMTEQMIYEWNEMISDKDEVYVLGDFAWGNKENVSNIISRLNGRKILVMGNHDRSRTAKWWMDAGFDVAVNGGIILDGFYLLSHEPMHLTKSMPYVNIHGHIHSQKMEGNQYVNVSVEQINYRPILFDSIKSRYK